MLNSQDTTTQSICDNFDTFQRHAAWLHRGAAWLMLWTTNAGDGRDRKESRYYPVGADIVPPARWREEKNLYYSVHGLSRTRRKHEASRNKDVCAVNCLFAEFDGKDFVPREVWQRFYVEPALDGLEPAPARGALQTAQSDAIQAAFLADKAHYKALALQHVQSLAQRPSTCVDSGGGFQCTWLLQETVHVTDANRAHVARLQRAFVDYVGADHGAHDLRRVLRVPGSRNHKRVYSEALEVAYLWADFERLYTFDELAALLPAEEPAPSPVHVRAPRALYTPPGLERLAMPAHVPPVPTCKEVDAYNAATPLPALLAQYGYTHAGPGRMHRPGGSTAGVELHAEDNSATIYSSADPLYLGRRIRPADALLVFAHAGDVDALLEALGATDTASMPTALEALRLWARREHFEPYIPEELRRRGYRTKGRDKCCLSAVLDIMASQERQSLCAPVSVGQLEEAANVGRASAHRALEALSHAILELVDGAGWPGKARRYRVRPAIVAEALRMYRAQSFRNGTCIAVEAKPVTTCSVSETLQAHMPLHTHKAHDAFCYVATPLTEEAWQARLQAAREAEEPEPVLTAQLRRRKAASLASLGRNALLVVDLLEEWHGQAQKKAVREALGMSAPTLAKTLGRLEEAGLVRLGHYSVELVELRADWSDHLDEVTPYMPTAGAGKRRQYRSASQRAAYYAQALEHAPPTEQPYLRRRLAEAEAQRNALEQEQGLHERRRKERARERLQGLHQNARMALVQEAEAVQPALEQEVQRLRYAGTDKAEAQRMLQIAGYAPRAIRRAMQRYWPPLVSREPDLHKVFDSSNWSQKRYTSAARL